MNMTTELLDRKALTWCVENWDQLPWTRQKDSYGTSITNMKSSVIRLLDETKSDGSHHINYIDNQLPFKSREYIDGIGLQNTIREIRNTITYDIYNDYDIVNCAPTILTCLALYNGLQCSHLQDYCEHRNNWITKASEVFKCSPNDVKQQVNYFIDGMVSMPYCTKKYIALMEEIKVIQRSFWDNPEFSVFRRYVEKQNKDNPIGSFMSCILQFYEATILDTAISYLKQQNIPIDHLVKIFDGFMLEKQYSVDLQVLNSYIFDTTGLQVEFIIKPMKDRFNLVNSKIKKIEIKVKPGKDHSEDKHIDKVYVNTLWHDIPSKKPPKKDGNIEMVKAVNSRMSIPYLNQFLRFVDIGKPFIIELTDSTDCGHIFHTKTDGLKRDTFLPIYHHYVDWLASTNRCTVTGVHYQPYLKIKPPPSTMFNLFKGFKYTKREPFDDHFTIDMEQVNPWLDLIKHNWCDDNDVLFNYVIQWFAHKIQYPDQKLVSSIVITSKLEGIGKNTFFDFFNSHVIGNEFGLLVGSVDELLERFNEHYEMSLIVCCDELKTTGLSHDTTDALKKLVTQTKRNIEGKFMAKRCEVNDFNDYVFFTNNFSVIKPSMSDRRYLCMEANCDRANKHEYWNHLYQFKNDVSGKNVFYYLSNLDLTNFDSRNIPMTEWKRELKESSIDPIIRSVINTIINWTPNVTNPDEEVLLRNVDLYEEYLKLTDDKNYRIANNSYSRQLQKILSLKTTSRYIDGQTCRGFWVSYNQLRRIIATDVLKDPEYDFEPSLIRIKSSPKGYYL